MAVSAKKAQKVQSEAENAATDSTKAVGPMSEDVQKVWLDLWADTQRFVVSRIQQDLEAQKAIFACKNLVDVQKVQTEFYTNAMEDYRAQASRIMEMMSAVAPIGLDSVPLVTRRRYDDVPL
ncbi:phasin family protein [Roseovarius sp. S4756]|uniref:phasin family protein n=1 Tax=Roseovarius maritimus TaxID=3342637 RepID=UPI003727ACD2